MNLPEKWSIKKFSECFENISPGDKKIKKRNYLEEGKFPIIDQGEEFIAGFTTDSTKIQTVDSPVIIFGDHTRRFKFVKFDFAVGADGTKILKAKNDIIDSKFSYYQLLNAKFPDKGYSRHFQYLKKVLLKVPDSISEQHLIVSEIEKQFTRLDAAVAGLRDVKQKLELYRKSILKAAFDIDSDFKTKKIGDFERKGGGTPSTKVKEYWDGDINWITSASIDERNRINYDKKISELGLKHSATNLVPKGSVIIVTRVGLGKVAVNEEPTTFSQDSQGIICNNINPYFLMWQVKSAANQIISKGQGTTISGITVNKLNEINVKVPSSEKQTQIVHEIESRFSVIDKLEETVDNALLKAEQLRKSILKTAFEGKLVRYTGDHNGSRDTENMKHPRQREGKALSTI